MTIGSGVMAASPLSPCTGEGYAQPTSGARRRPAARSTAMAFATDISHLQTRYSISRSRLRAAAATGATRCRDVRELPAIAWDDPFLRGIVLSRGLRSRTRSPQPAVPPGQPVPGLRAGNEGCWTERGDLRRVGFRQELAQLQDARTGRKVCTTPAPPTPFSPLAGPPEAANRRQKGAICPFWLPHPQ